jgi:hypothetical protein
MGEEVLPRSRPEVISGKYIIQYLFAAGSTAAVVPLIRCIGVGLTFTICKTFPDPLGHTDTNHLIPI